MKVGVTRRSGSWRKLRYREGEGERGDGDLRSGFHTGGIGAVKGSGS